MRGQSTDSSLLNKRIAVVGSGSWATAIAKMVLSNVQEINWFMRSQAKIEEFKQLGRNPSYLSAASFDTSRIHFTSDINEIAKISDVLIVAIPSPFLKTAFNKLRRSIRQKIIISATKGMVQEDNMIISDYMHFRFNVPMEQIGVITGPCHAEEVALERMSYLTIGCPIRERAGKMAELFATPYIKTSLSDDICGLEYSSVLKNMYAIAAGIAHGLKYGDNFLSVLISNSIQEMSRFASSVVPMHRCINDSAYLGDLLVTAYSRFSRNHQFGEMIGIGYSVKAAQLEMEMVSEGYYGTNCIHQLNERYQVSMPIMDAVYDILYQKASPTIVFKELSKKLM